MRTFFVSIVLVAVAGMAAADNVYRWTDKDGVVHYTDKPPAPGAKPAELPPLQTFKPDTAASLGSAPSTPAPPAAAAPARVVITAPAAEETIRDAEGKVPVSVEAALADGDGIIYTLDGAAQNTVATPSTAFLLSGIERGEHHVGARVVDAAGKTKATATPVTVYLMPPSVKR